MPERKRAVTRVLEICIALHSVGKMAGVDRWGNIVKGAGLFWQWYMRYCWTETYSTLKSRNLSRNNREVKCKKCRNRNSGNIMYGTTRKYMYWPIRMWPNHGVAACNGRGLVADLPHLLVVKLQSTECCIQTGCVSKTIAYWNFCFSKHLRHQMYEQGNVQRMNTL